MSTGTETATPALAPEVASGGPATPGGRGPRAGRLRLPDQTLARNLLLTVGFGVILFILSENFDPFTNLRLATVAYYFTALAGLTVLTGLNGQISLGHGALMAVGAYATVILVGRTGLPLGAALVAAAVITALVGVVVGAAASRLRGPYLAGATLAFAIGLPGLADRYPHAFGGENGLNVAPPTPPASLGLNFPLERWEAWIACVCALVVFLVLANLLRSRVGRAFRAVRDDEVAAQLAGLNVARTQVLAFVVSAACAGLGGGALVVVTQLAAPGAFVLSLSLALLTGIVLGGLGSLAGALWGALALVYLPQWSDDIAHSFSLSNNVQSNLPLALYGIVLIVVIVAAPQGIQGALRRLVRTAEARRRKPPSTPTEEGSS
ncbi:MAG TPA: branched-chain amino acid ABC transporter permease [Thermoleophilaceae bacterium]|jgi:branched-chain amino acid transport system permease protein